MGNTLYFPHKNEFGANIIDGGANIQRSNMIHWEH
jgi:hypothetical protein